MVELSAIRLSMSLLNLLMVMEDFTADTLKIYRVFNFIEVTSHSSIIYLSVSTCYSLTAILQVLGKMAVHHTSSIEVLSRATMRMMQVTAGRKLEALDPSSWVEHCRVARRCLPCMQT